MDTYEKWLRKRLGYDLTEEFAPSGYAQEKAKLFFYYGKYRRQRLDIIAWNDPSYLKWAFKKYGRKLPTGIYDFIMDNKEKLEEDIKAEKENEEWL